jgi:hypothetical protein
MFKLSR